MNRKTIHAVLSKKMEHWIKSIDDKELQKDVRRDVIVTGGAIASMLLQEHPKDYDVYFKTKATTKKVTEYYIKKFNEAKQGGPVAKIEETEDRIKIMIRSAGVATEDSNEDLLNEPFEDAVEALEEADNISEESLEGDGYRPIFLSSNAITLSNKVQLVIRFFGEPEDIHKNYDFVHCTNYWTFSGKVVLKPEAMEALLNKELVYQGSKYPLCSVIRTRKFIQRGFKINAGQYLKMMFQISELNLKDLQVLEDQLVGVDSAYFNMLINSLKKQVENKPDFDLSQDYVSSIIDRIF